MPIPRATGSRAVVAHAAASQTVAATGKEPSAHTGAAAREKAMQEFEATRQARETRALGLDWAAYNATRFRLDDPSRQARSGYTPRYAADIIILDKTWDDPYFIYGHTIFEQGKGYTYELCAHESFNCPICPTLRVAGGGEMKHGTYEMHCSALDITPTQEQEDQARAEETEFRRKRAFAISNQLHPTFFNLFKECMDAHGTIRGMMLLMERTADFNSAIGKPVMRPNGAMYDFITEEELREFAHPELRDTVTNEIVKPADFDITAFDYPSIFPKIDKAYVDRQRTVYGSGAPGAGRSDDAPADGWRNRDRSGGTEQAAAAPAAPTRTRQRSTYAVGTAPGAAPKAEAQTEQEVHEVPDDGGQVSAPATPTNAKTLPRIRQRSATAAPSAPVAPPSGEPVRPGATRQRQRGGVAGKAAAGGVDADIPWTGN